MAGVVNVITTQCKNSNGDLLGSRNEVLGRWIEYFSALLNTDEVELIPEPQEAQNAGHETEDQTEHEPPTMEEIREGTKKWANYKFSGSCRFLLSLSKTVAKSW